MTIRNFITAIVILAVLFVGFCTLAHADKTTGVQTASAAYVAGKYGGIFGVDIIHNGTTSCTLYIYDGTGTVASTAIFGGLCYASGMSSCTKEFNNARKFRNGFYVSVSGSGCSYIVNYDLNLK